MTEQPSKLNTLNPERFNRPERLSDEQMVNLLASCGNLESKALTLMLMKPGIIYSHSGISGLVQEAQGRGGDWTVSRQLASRYLVESFIPIGLVAREVTDDLDRSYGYVKTDYGHTTGTPLAALLLRFSLNHPEISLYQLLGSSASSSRESSVVRISDEDVTHKNRSMGARLKIFLELLTASLPVREQDIIDATGLDHGNVSIHLKQLSRFGLITHASRGVSEGFSLYGLSQDVQAVESPILRRGDIALTDSVFQIIRSQPERFWGVKEIAQVVAEQKGRLSEDKLYGRVSHALAVLKTKGVLGTRDYDRLNQSSVELTDSQKATIYDFLSLVMRFQDQDPEIIKEGQALATSFTKEEINTLLRKASEVSPYIQKRRQVKDAFIIDLLRQNPGMSHSEIYQMMSEQFPTGLSSGSLSQTLTRLTEGGLIAKGDQRIHGKIVWFPVVEVK